MKNARKMLVAGLIAGFMLISLFALTACGGDSETGGNGDTNQSVGTYDNGASNQGNEANEDTNNNPNNADGIIGVWAGIGEGGMRYRLTFNADGTGRQRVNARSPATMVLQNDAFTWESITDGQVTITLGVNTWAYYYEIDGSTLSLESVNPIAGHPSPIAITYERTE